MATKLKREPTLSDVMKRMTALEKRLAQGSGQPNIIVMPAGTPAPAGAQTSPLVGPDGRPLRKTAQNTVSDVDKNGPGFFSPGQPQRPMGPPGEKFRVIDYEVGRNIRTSTKDEGVTYEQLRALAKYHDLTRLLIETRKDQMEALNWDIGLRKMAGDDPEEDVEPNDEQAARITATKKFFDKPDGQHFFGTWLRSLIEDLLVIDAPTVYVNQARAGDTRFEILDGATIRRVVDEQGRTPEPPDPAYQQIIKGLPAWNFDTDELVWMPRNLGPDRLFGYSPVEQIVMTVNIALRRQTSVLEYFTAGNVPDAFIGVPDAWTPDQIVDYQTAWDALNAGNLAERRRAKFIPGSAKVTQTREVMLKNEFDEWLARVCCYAFSIPPTAFIKAMNRATADNQKEQAQEEGLGPLQIWFKQFMNLLIQDKLGQWDLEFFWDEQVEQDPTERSTIQDKQVRNGSKTLNQIRADNGDDPIEGGDTPMIYMGAQPIPVKVAAGQTEMPGAAAAQGNGALPGLGGGPAGNGKPGAGGAANGKRPPGAAGKPASGGGAAGPGNNGRGAGSNRQGGQAASGKPAPKGGAKPQPKGKQPAKKVALALRPAWARY